jgi:hypothetical protein
MRAATASTTGWIEAHPGAGPECLFCDQPLLLRVQGWSPGVVRRPKKRPWMGM